MSGRALGACVGLVAVLGIGTLPLRDRQGEARPSTKLGAGASSTTSTTRAHLRDEALRHARTRLGDIDHDALTSAPPDPGGVLANDTVTCQFVPHLPDGTTQKFDCALAGGEIVRVKYGHEPEIHAEAAATRLLAALG